MRRPPADPSASRRAAQVLRRLQRFYGPPPEGRKHDDPMAELVQTILSQNTSDANSDRSYARLRQRFGSWEAILAAPIHEVADAIRIGGLAEIKAARIQKVLRQIDEDRGELSLDFLRGPRREAAMAYLLELDGVGRKTASCVLLFSLGKAAIPVDTHVHRVARRLGLIGSKATADQAHGILESVVPRERHYAFHMHLIRHGRQICNAPRPRCSECPLEAICPKVGVSSATAR